MELYTPEELDKIVTELGKLQPNFTPDHLTKNLEKTAAKYVFDTCKAHPPAPHMLAKRLGAAGKPGARIRTLMKGDGFHLQFALHDAAVRSGMELDLSRLREPATQTRVKELAVEAAQQERLKVEKNKASRLGRSGPVARTVFVKELAHLWWDAKGTIAGASVDPYSGKIGGPFVRFALACHQPLETRFSLKEMKGEAVRDGLRADI